MINKDESKQNIIGIIGALEEEIEIYLQNATSIQTVHWNEFEFHEALLFGEKVVIVKSGVGKVLAAMICQKLIDEYAPELIINTGSAGALNVDLEIGDIVISKDCIQWDMDVRELGFSRGEIPYTNFQKIPADKKLIESVLSSQIYNHNIKCGRILTGDQFLSKSKIKEYSFLTDELHGDAIEMESAAYALVCTINQIPFIIFRTITDKADGSAAVDFNKFLPIVGKNSFEVVKTLITKPNLVIQP